MTEETNAPESQEPQVATLDDVINEFNVPNPAPTPTPTAPVEPRTAVPAMPEGFDPLDEASVKNYAALQNQNLTALQSHVQELNTKLTQSEQHNAKVKVEADIRSAVETVSSEIDNADPVMVEIYLEKMAREKPGFQAIWDNRATNPGAFNKALKAVSNDLKGRYDFKADPQLAENHRAANQSQQQSETTTTPTYANADEESLAGAKTDAEWNREWQKIKQG
jgi:hypothetical protein